MIIVCVDIVDGFAIKDQISEEESSYPSLLPGDHSS